MRKAPRLVRVPLAVLSRKGSRARAVGAAKRVGFVDLGPHLGGSRGALDTSHEPADVARGGRGLMLSPTPDSLSLSGR